MSTREHSPDPAWQRYARLNSAIVQEVFEQDVAGQPVYLDLEPDVLARIAKHMGDNPSTEPDGQLIEVVKATLSSPDGAAGLFSAHTIKAWLWEFEGNSSPPPCIAVLAMLSLVAERMKRSEEFAGSNYYGRLSADARHRCSVSGPRGSRLPQGNAPSCGTRSTRWLEECNGRRGLPTAVAFDRRRFIGLPLSQALVRAQDRAQAAEPVCAIRTAAGSTRSLFKPCSTFWVTGSRARKITQSLKRLWSKSYQQGKNLRGRMRRAGRLGRHATQRPSTGGAQARRQPLPGGRA